MPFVLQFCDILRMYKKLSPHIITYFFDFVKSSFGLMRDYRWVLVILYETTDVFSTFTTGGKRFFHLHYFWFCVILFLVTAVIICIIYGFYVNVISE